MELQERFERKAEELRSRDPVEFWPVAAAVLAIGIGFWLRYRPAQGMQYLQALDPYMIFRMSQHLALEGHLPQLDFMRYFPYATPTYKLQIGNIAVPAVMYYMGPFLFMDYLTWARAFPAVMGALSVGGVYLLGRELWDEYAGAASAFFLAVIAGAMHRTSAGFFEKEPVGTFFMVMSMFFFVRAWNLRNRYYGMAAGVSLALFSVSWGGSKMLWLLYPLVAGTVAFFDEDIENLVAAYTPTVLLGGLLAAAINPSRFWYTGSIFVANLGVLSVIWIRYLAGELELVEEGQLPYVVPAVSALGGIAALLSPLYSDWLGDKVMGVISRVNQASGGDVIAGTVAENQAAGIGQLVGQLGAARAMGVNGFLGILANVAGTWPLAFLGIPMMATVIVGALGAKYGAWSSRISSNDYLKMFLAVYLGWLLSFSYFFQDSIMFAAAPATLMAVAGAIAAYSFDMLDEVNLEIDWYVALPFFWTVTNVLGAVAKSRLVFLATFSVAVAAGYAFSRAFVALKDYDYTGVDPDNPEQIRAGVLAVVLGLVLLVNGASGYAASQNLGGSPNGAWMDSLEWMEQNTEDGGVLLSWWDYGYWFESIARRGAAADGGNMGYYSGDRFGKTNYPIADYLTGKTDGSEVLERHSVDYIVLDSTMIGKYQAVSQISARNNSFFYTMRSLNTRGSLSSELQGSNTATFQGRSRMTVYADISPQGDIEGTPTVESPLGRGQVDCVLSEDGRQDFEVNNTVEVPSVFFHQPASVRDTLEVCVAEHPYRSFERGLQGARAGVVLVPKQIADSNLAKLYLMNGATLDYAEPVPGASNGYVRVWNVTGVE